MTPKQAARLAELRRQRRVAGPAMSYKSLDSNATLYGLYLELEREVASAVAYKAMTFAIKGTAMQGKDPFLHWDRTGGTAHVNMGRRVEEPDPDYPGETLTVFKGARVSVKIRKQTLYVSVEDTATDSVVWKKKYGQASNLAGPAIDAGHQARKLLPQ